MTPYLERTRIARSLKAAIRRVAPERSYPPRAAREATMPALAAGAERSASARPASCGPP